MEDATVLFDIFKHCVAHHSLLSHRKNDSTCTVMPAPQGTILPDTEPVGQMWVPQIVHCCSTKNGATACSLLCALWV